jgi:hypothetical protein
VPHLHDEAVGDPSDAVTNEAGEWQRVQLPERAGPAGREHRRHRREEHEVPCRRVRGACESENGEAGSEGVLVWAVQSGVEWREEG